MGYDNKLQELMETLEQNPKLYQEQEGYQAWRDLLALGVEEFKEQQVIIPKRFTTKEKDKRVFGNLIEPEWANKINRFFEKSQTKTAPQKKELDSYVDQMSVFFRQPAQETDFQKIFYSQMFERVAEGAVSIIRKGSIKKSSSSLRRLLATGWGHRWPEAQIFLARLDKKKLQELGIYNKETLNKRRIQANAYFKNDLRDKRLDEAYRLLQIEAEKDWRDYIGENGGQDGHTPPAPENGGDEVPPTTPTPENGGEGVPPTSPAPENGDGGVPPTSPTPENGGDEVPLIPPTPENGGDSVPPTPPTPENGGDSVPPTPPTPENGDSGVPPTSPALENGGNEVPPTPPAPENGGDEVPPTPPTPENGGREGGNTQPMSSDTRNNGQGKYEFVGGRSGYITITNPEYAPPPKRDDIAITVTDPNYAPPKPQKEEDITITVTDPNYAEPKGKTTLVERLEAKKYVYTYTPKVAGSKYQLTGKGISDLYKKKNERD